MAEARTERTVERAGEEARHLGESAREAYSERRRRAVDAAEEQKHRAVGTMEVIADALSSSGSKLREEQGERFAGFVEMASERMSDAARSLRGQNVEDLARRTRELARRHPATFLGGAFALGFGLTRLLKASGHGWALTGDWPESGYEPGFAGYETEGGTEASAGAGMGGAAWTPAQPASPTAAEGPGTYTATGPATPEPSAGTVEAAQQGKTAKGRQTTGVGEMAGSKKAGQEGQS